jgi:zinc protease
VGCAFILVALVGLPAARVLAADGDLSSFRLDNGLQIYVVEKHTSPIAAVQVWYRTGSLNERPGIRGLSHLFEHMMFRGSEHFGPEEHFRRIAEVGGTNNAHTTDDVTVYEQVVPVDAVNLVMEMEADRMARLKLDEDMLRTEVEVVKEEYRVNVENDPFNRLIIPFAKEYFGDHPYGYAVIGAMSDLDTVSVATCEAYYRGRYAPNNATLIVAGDVEPAAVLASAERQFGVLPAFDGIAPDPPPPPQVYRPEMRAKGDLPVPLTMVAFRLPPSGHPDALALEVFSKALADRLDGMLTRESSLCIQTDVFDQEYRQLHLVGFLGVHFPAVPSERVRQAIETHLELMLSEPMRLDELDRTRNRMLFDETVGRTQVESIASDLGDALLVAEDIRCYTDRLDMLAELTPETVTEAARRHFTPANRTEVLIEPSNTPLLIKLAGWFATTLHL